MGKYDKIFYSDDISEVTLSSEEAAAAIAVITVAADTSLENADTELLVDILWGFEIFEEYSDEDLLTIVNRLLNLAKEMGLGALFNTAIDFLPDELVLDAFAGGVSAIVDEEEIRIPPNKMPLLKELQSALEVEDDEAKEVIEDVLSAFEEAEEEEYIDYGFEDVLDLEVYESPLSNFTVPVPVDLQEGGRIQTQEGIVSFTDDFGTLLRIDYYPLPAEQKQEMQSVGREKYLGSILLDKYIPQAIVANLTEAQVKYTKYQPEILQGACFALVDMPKGSTISKTGYNGTATRLDAYRGLLAFMKGDFLYIITCQQIFFEGETPGTIEEEAEELKDQLFAFVDTIEFN
ncbi:MAG: hypothetical protein QNJ47_23155 [Nostocaceae cyanobacterium]|nr:hypothetical protein [Nostocaceae cyanobacterium]